MVLTVAAGLTGSWILYLLGRLGGPKVMGFYFKKFPKHQAVIEEKMEFLREKGCIGVFAVSYTHLDVYKRQHFTKLIYALGSECFIPPMEGSSLPEVVAIRRLADVEKAERLMNCLLYTSRCV